MPEQTAVQFPIVLEPSQLQENLSAPDIRIIDLCRQEQYVAAHIPGAVHLDYAQIIRNNKPVFGLLPEEDTFAALLSKAGITPRTHVIAYDDEGGGKASRLLWTLAATNHERYSLLNGGIVAWANEGHELSREVPQVERAVYPVKYNDKFSCDRTYILMHLNDATCKLVDCRSPEEYSGQLKRAARGGHIPGAVNMDWMLLKDPNNNLRLIDDGHLRQLLSARNIEPGQEVILYCHSHHRSALAFIALQHLGFRNLKGYAGSWSDWAHAQDTPVSTDV